jgi:thymidylate synthase (FAD)
MLEITKKWVPHCYEAFIKYRQTGKEFSGAAVEVLKRKLKGEKINQEESGLSSREWGELTKVFEF